MRALVLIDYTVDFVVGKLPCGDPAVAIETRICDLTLNFVKKEDFVVMAVDLHDEGDPYHPETKLFPPHNLRGTMGRELYGNLKKMYEAHLEAIYWMDKTRYSAFCGTDLEQRLRARGIQELHLHTAVDAYNKGFSLVIHEDAVASFDARGHAWALQHFEQTLGAKVVRDWKN